MFCTQCGSAVSRDDAHFNPTSLGDLRSQLSRLDTLIASLTAERQRLQAESDAIVYPVLSLPTEITEEIFQRCLLSQPQMPCPSKAPLLLTQICQHWREIALNTPGLWQSLLFKDRESSVELLRLWLSRSGTLPSTFSLHCWDPLRASTLIEAVMPHAHRWQDVQFGLPLSSFGDFNLKLRHTSFPILRAISLDILQRTADDQITETVAIKDAPALCEVHVSTFPKIKILVSWSQMASLTLRDGVEFMECLSLLRACPALVNLTVHTCGFAASHTDVLALHSLQALDCNISDGADTLLQYLTPSRLERLAITDTGTVERASVLTAFLRRSFCQIRYLSLLLPNANTVLPENLALFFRAVPDSVSELHLAWRRGPLPENLFPALLPVDILPQLTALYLRGGPLFDADYQSLVEMLTLRTRYPPLLRSVVLDVTTFSGRSRRNTPSILTLFQLRALASAGLKIKFTATTRGGQNSRVVLDSDAILSDPSRRAPSCI
ncbi:hypothetical protein DFH06DRAFT_1481033 [Mycena polygramma]|nr:hypothetical protein DFH06DRAFT_1481033 [Mycena polygramma]